jgi:glycosyltransferase involved in cell wall biosynthesis
MKVSIIIPSYNHAHFIRATLDSVLTQEYDDLEILVFDGGSSDGTVSILESYGDKISFVSRKDDGQADAINQGLQQSSGDVLAYLNSDDIYYPGAIRKIAEHFNAQPECLALYGDANHLHVDGSVMEPYYTEPWSYPRLFKVCYLCQPAVFWRREIMERFGLFDASLQYALDYDYWLRVGREVDFYYLRGACLAGSRLHLDTKTLKQRVKVHREILEVAMRHANEPPDTWLMNLAHVIVEAEEQRRAPAQMNEQARHALFAQAVLESADAQHIPIRHHLLAYLEQTLAV